jgi:hypothetical protein
MVEQLKRPEFTMLAVLAYLLFSGGIGAQAQDALTSAIASYNKRNYKAAAEALRPLAEAKLGATANYYLGLSYLQLGYAQQAQLTFELLVKQWPESQEARLASTYLAKVAPIGQKASPVGLAPLSPEQGGSHESGAGSGKGIKLITRAEWEALPKKTRIPIQREHGHLWVNAKVNGRYCKMLFDTGATGCCLSLVDFPDLVPKEVLQKAETTYVSRVYGVVPVKRLTTEISLQDIMRKVPTVFIQEKGCSLIGQNFFKEYSYQVDDFYLRLTKAPFEGEGAVVAGKSNLAAVLSPAQSRLPVKTKNDKYSLFFEKEFDTMLVNIAVNNKPIKACFDTGCAPDGIVMNHAMAQDFGVRNNMLERLEVGPVIRMHVRVYYADGVRHPLIGPKIFNRPYTVDQELKQIRFDY